jgi:hypothetical protein
LYCAIEYVGDKPQNSVLERAAFYDRGWNNAVEAVARMLEEYANTAVIDLADRLVSCARDEAL